MVRNYLTVAIRNLLRHKGFAAINVLGLAVGAGCCVLAMVYIRHEMAYDRFHENSDRIYRVIRELSSPDAGSHFHPGSPGPMAAVLRETYPEVDRSSRLWVLQDVWVRNGGQGLKATFAVADPALLDIFTIRMVDGDGRAALSVPGNVLIAQSTARKFFGQEDPIGRQIAVENRRLPTDFIVAGVFQDFPSTSSYRFEMLTSTEPRREFGWWRGGWIPYSSDSVQALVLLREGADARALEHKMGDLVPLYHGKEFVGKYTYHLQALEDVHLLSLPDLGISESGDWRSLILLACVAALVLLIGCVNYVNLSTARASVRGPEIGLRKTVGAGRGQIAAQFVAESTLVAAASVALGLVLAYLALPEFRVLVERDLQMVPGPALGVGALVLVVVVGLFAGAYPATYLSSLSPTMAIRSRGGLRSRCGAFRKGLVVLQFTTAIALVVSTLVVKSQLQYVRNADLGFDADQVVVMPLFSLDRSLTARFRTVRDAFMSVPGAIGATASQVVMGVKIADKRQMVFPEGKEGENWQMFHLAVDENFLATYGIDLVAGRNLSVDDPTNRPDSWLINETAAKQLGWDDPLGKKMVWSLNKVPGTVVGVVKDFHLHTLHQPIGPAFLFFWARHYDLLSVKLHTDDVRTSLAGLERMWKRFIPDRPFEFSFLDESTDALYQADKRTSRVFEVFSALTVFIACLGLFSLSSYVVERRTREIGVRRVLGATVSGTALLLCAELVAWVGAANLFAWPISYLFMRDWLEGFAHRTQLTVWPFLAAGTVALSVSFVAVVLQTWRAATVDPVDTLRAG